MTDYAHPEVLVSTDWVDEHKDDANVAVDTAAYQEGHIPGAIGWNWQTQLCDTLKRDIISQEDHKKLLGESGIGNDFTIVLYGDNNNWFAAWALWQLKLYWHDEVRIMDGGPEEMARRGTRGQQGVPDPRINHL